MAAGSKLRLKARVKVLQEKTKSTYGSIGMNGREPAISLSLDTVLRRIRDVHCGPEVAWRGPALQSTTNNRCFGLEQRGVQSGSMRYASTNAMKRGSLSEFEL